MNIEFILIIISVWLVLWVIIAYLMQEVAFKKGYNTEVHAFACCFWLGIFGCLYVIALPDKNIQEQNKEILDLLRNSKMQENNYNDLPSM
jgi:hypothetical protein